MPNTDDQVLQMLRELRAAGPVLTAAARVGKPARRSDGEVARAIMALEIALSSPSFQAVLGGGPPAAPRRGRARSVDTAAAVAAVAPESSFCEIYKEVKDYIDIALEALDWLPVPYATTVAKVIRLLEKFADRACRS